MKIGSHSRFVLVDYKKVSPVTLFASRELRREGRDRTVVRSLSLLNKGRNIDTVRITFARVLCWF